MCELNKINAENPWFSSFVQEMSAQARKFLRQYKKLFNELAAQNQGNNALTLAAENVKPIKEDEKRYVEVDGQSPEEEKPDVTGVNVDTDTRFALLTDEDLAEYMATGKTLHTRHKKQRMLENGKKPILTSESEIREFISNAIQGKAGGEVRAFARVPKRLAEAISDVRSTLDLEGDYLEFQADALREAYKVHSSPKMQSDIALSESDFENLHRHIFDFDGVLSVNDYHGKTEVHIYRRAENGYYQIITVSSSERKSLQITKLIGVSKEKFEEKYEKKIERNTGSPRMPEASNPSTKARHTAGALSTVIISETEGKINPSDENSSKNPLKKRFALPETDSEGRSLSPQQQEYFKDSRAVDSQGRLLVLYHQTGAEFTIFDTKREGAGARDNETPHGIFLKPTADDIWLKGSKQMQLYANITNPLQFYTRGDALWHWKQNIEGYADVIAEIAANDRAYGERFDEAFDLKRMARRRRNMEFSAMDRATQDALFEESEAASEKVLEEWKEANTALDKKAKALIDAYLEKNGYDGVLLREDQGSFGRKVQTYIALHPEQVKNTDNAAPSGNPDIRFALTDYTEEQYNSFGWANYAGAITTKEIDDLYSKIQPRTTLHTFKQSSKGEAIIEVNKKPHTTLDVDNVFVFVKGTKNNFYINRVVRFNAETETEMEIIKEALYERGTWSDSYLPYYERENIAKEYRRENSKSFEQYKQDQRSGSSRQESRGANQNNRGRAKYRSGYSLNVGEDGELKLSRILPRYLEAAPTKDLIRRYMAWRMRQKKVLSLCTASKALMMALI